MRVVKGEPPIYAEVEALMGDQVRTAFFTYGEVVYSPSGQDVPDEIMAHEEVHQDRQLDGPGPAGWWIRWLADPRFRLDEEARGFGGQLRWIKRRMRDGEKRNAVAIAMAEMLSGPLYGHLGDHNAAARLIAKYSR